MATKLSELPTGQAISKLIDETVTASRTAASTNTVIPVLTLNRQSSGTPGAGIGGSLAFNVETAAGNTETGATIEAVTTDVTSTSEDFDIVFKTMSAGGAAAERFRITSGGVIGGSGVASISTGGGVSYFGTIVASYAINAAGPQGFRNNDNAGQYKLGASDNVGFAYNAAGVARVSDGSTGIGSILSKALVEANTAGSGAPNVLVGNESTTILTNEGATAQNYHTLPTAVAGLVFEFVVQDADGIRVVAATGDTIQDVGTVSATAGYIQSTTIGSVIRLAAINATQWVVMSKQGTWTVDS